MKDQVTTVFRHHDIRSGASISRTVYEKAGLSTNRTEYRLDIGRLGNYLYGYELKCLMELMTEALGAEFE